MGITEQVFLYQKPSVLPVLHASVSILLQYVELVG